MSSSERLPSWPRLLWAQVCLWAAWAVVLVVLGWIGLIERCRRWQCRRQFAALDPHEQEVMRFMRADPESLIERGKL